MNEKKKALLDLLKRDSKKESKYINLLVTLLFQKLKTDKYKFDGKTVYNADKSILICYSSDSERVTLPDTLKTIGTMALKNHKKLVRLTIPSSVETIEQDAVSGCDLLQIVRIPASVKTIKSFAFSRNKSLKRVVFDGVPDHISRHTFDYCHELLQIEVPFGSSELFCKELHIDEKSNLKIVEVPSIESK
jgi:hypothetical protein